MKIKDIIFEHTIQIDESIKFSPAIKKQTQNGVVWDPLAFSQKEEVTCNRCNGQGCDHCKNTGKHIDITSFAPELEVGEETAKVLQNLLGVSKIDLVGVIEPEQLDDVLNKLMKFKTFGLKHFNSIQDTNTKDQIGYILDQLIEIVEFAKDKGAGLSWS